MKIEKNIIVLSIIALIIGIATITPIAYLTANTSQNKALFNIDILYADALLDIDNQNPALSRAWVASLVNFTATPEANKIKDADLLMDIYNFHFYSDQASIANAIYAVIIDKTEREPINPDTPVVIEGTSLIQAGWIMWPNGSSVDPRPLISPMAGFGAEGLSRGEKSVIGSPGGVIRANIDHVLTFYNMITKEGTDEVVSIPVIITGDSSTQTLDYLISAQALYVNVTRIMTATHQYQTGLTTTNVTDNEVIAHIELTKVDNGFVYGNYEQVVETTGREPTRHTWSPTITIRLDAFSEYTEGEP